MSRFIFLIFFILTMSFLIIHNNFVYNDLMREHRNLVRDIYTLQEDIKKKLYLLEKRNVKRENTKKTIVIDPLTVDY